MTTLHDRQGAQACPNTPEDSMSNDADTPVRWIKACARSACVEVSLVGIRDSKNLTGFSLDLPADQIGMFLQAAKNGEFDELLVGEV